MLSGIYFVFHASILVLLASDIMYRWCCNWIKAFLVEMRLFEYSYTSLKCYFSNYCFNWVFWTVSHGLRTFSSPTHHKCPDEDLLNADETTSSYCSSPCIPTLALDMMTHVIFLIFSHQLKTVGS